MEKNNITHSTVQGTSVEQKTFKFEVGKKYKQNGLEFKVLERKGRKAKIEYTDDVYIGEIFRKGTIENKIIKVAEGNGLYIEILSWAWGWRRLLGVEVNAVHVVEETPKKKTFEEELEERWAEEENYLNSLPEEEAIAYCKAKLKEFEQYEKEYLNK